MPVWTQIIWVAIGGALGALARFGIGEATRRFSIGEFSLGNINFPLGTLLANLVGCFLIGLLMGSGHPEKHITARLGIGVGFLGSLTTFSTFSAETVIEFHRGNAWIAIANVFVSLTSGLLLVMLGLYLGKRWLA